MEGHGDILLDAQHLGEALHEMGGELEVLIRNDFVWETEPSVNVVYVQFGNPLSCDHCLAR